MDKAVADVSRWRFSTDALPERERGAAVHALYGHHTVVAYQALPDVPVYLGFTQRWLPGLVLQMGPLRRCVSGEPAGISPTA